MAYAQAQAALYGEVQRAQAHVARAEAELFAQCELVAERDSELRDAHVKLARMQAVLDRVL